VSATLKSHRQTPLTERHITAKSSELHRKLQGKQNTAITQPTRMDMWRKAEPKQMTYCYSLNTTATSEAIEETRVTGVKWQLCLDSLKQLSSAANRVSCLLRATPGNVIMDHEFHAGGAVLHRANITSSSQIKLRTDISSSESARVRHVIRVSCWKCDYICLYCKGTRWCADEWKNPKTTSDGTQHCYFICKGKVSPRHKYKSMQREERNTINV